MSGRRFTAAIAAVGALSLCATMAFAGAPDAYADTYSSTVVASASTTTSGTIPAGQLSVVNFHPKWETSSPTRPPCSSTSKRRTRKA